MYILYNTEFILLYNIYVNHWWNFEGCVNFVKAMDEIVLAPGQYSV